MMITEPFCISLSLFSFELWHLIKYLFNLFNSLEVLWSEKDVGASFVNLSCLPALLNSSCLHKSSCLSDLTSRASYMHVRFCYEFLAFCILCSNHNVMFINLTSILNTCTDMSSLA